MNNPRTVNPPALFYYISSHGYGHAVRSAEIIRNLNRLFPDLIIHARTFAPQNLFEDADCMVRVHPVSLDVGVAQTDGLTMDIPETIRRYRDLCRNLEKTIRDEIAAAQTFRPLAVISDIPAAAFRVSWQMGIPGLAVGNFSWDWIYEEWIREYPEITSIVDELFLDYQKADMLLQLPFSPDDWRSFRRKKNVPLIGRRSQREREETLKVLNLPEDKPLVLLSFGGMGLQSAQLSGLEELKDFQFISVGSYGAPGTSFSSEYLKQEGIKYQDLVRAADVVATKPGYGIVSECLANRTRILYTSRGKFREYPVLESAMKNQLAVKYIDPSRFRIGSWKAELIELMSQDPPDFPIDVSGAEQAARIILQAIH